MDGEFKYLEYITEDSNYYTKPKKREELEFSVENLDSTWVVNRNDSFWIMYFVPKVKMIEQGFKIHVSTAYENAANTLAIVSKLLIKKKVSFKHVRDKVALYSMYSKNGSRISAGKFITIYPNEKEFYPLLEELDAALKDQPKGPYILTDKRWGEGNVFFRYGAFRELKDKDGRYCILDPKGNLIEDLRKPKFHLPNFVELPEEIKQKDESTKKGMPAVENPLNLYEIEKVIRFSNAGGIYLATRKKDEKKCVIKEARNEIGLDGQNRNAMYRLQIEHKALLKLETVSGVVKALDYFTAWENKFLVLEFVEGVSLYSWVSAYYPFSKNADVNNYFSKVVQIVENLEKIVKEMHQNGVAMCDLQPQNILIDEGMKITIIDFEIAGDATEKSIPAMATRGFSNLLNTCTKDRDWYSLNRIMQFLLLPMGPVQDMDMSINTKHCIWIYNQFGYNNYKYFHDFQMQTRRKIEKFDEIFADTFNIAKQKIDTSETKIQCKRKEIFEKLKSALLHNCDPTMPSFINGDIRQYEMDCGMMNLQNGGFGAVYALLKLGIFNDNVKKWVTDQIPILLNERFNNGFLTGRSGIACVLYECGYKKEALQLMDLVVESYDKFSEDMSLRSGLTGIGIALACIGKKENKEAYLSLAQDIGKILVDKVDNNKESVGTDWQSYSIGLLDGYVGISVFLTLLYEITQNEKYLSFSEMVIDSELGKSSIIDEDGGLRLFDHKTSRMYPYLSNGSIGLGLAITALRRTNKVWRYEDVLNSIIKSLDYRIVLEPGLFDGISGFLLSSCFQKESGYVEEILDILTLFLLGDDKYFMPGKMFYKLSSDLHTGVSGAVLGIMAAEKKSLFMWLPLVGDFIH